MTGAGAALACPRCGAPAAPDASRCAHCGTPLALVACPACFARIFSGARHCSHCGAQAAREDPRLSRPARACPRCQQPLAAVLVGGVALDECPRCGGVWAGLAAFERILAEAEAQSAVLGAAAPAPADARAGPLPPYVPCPDCARLMNRVNFARCSGVLVDVCKGHGTWFDRDELRAIVAFVRGGGLGRSRAREKEELERQRLRFQEQLLAARQRAGGSPAVGHTPGILGGAGDGLDTLEALGSVGSALWDFLGE